MSSSFIDSIKGYRKVKRGKNRRDKEKYYKDKKKAIERGEKILEVSIH